MKDIVYEVTVEVLQRRTVRILSTSPETAAKQARENMREEFPLYATIEVTQVDYRTEEGGESHWYPA
jgi:hypothetical protein